MQEFLVFHQKALDLQLFRCILGSRNRFSGNFWWAACPTVGDRFPFFYESGKSAGEDGAHAEAGNAPDTLGVKLKLGVDFTSFGD